MNEFIDFKPKRTTTITFKEDEDRKQIKKNNNINLYHSLNNNITFDNHTMLYYKNLRLLKIDPITHKEMNDDNAFKFYDVWDPYSGERLFKDPYGPLYFDPSILIKYYYTNRLRKLWIEPHDDNTGYYQGYYSDAVGAGQDMYVKGRGYHPEWYVFRLPITDCYLTKDNNTQYITFGPKLTKEEIEEIDNKAALCNNNSYSKLRDMKQIYDIALSNKVDNEQNIKAVNTLIQMSLIIN